MKSIVLIPAYKPDARMTDLVAALAQRALTVIVIDDGSGTDYRALFERVKPFAQVVSCEQNGGKGAAIKIGLRYIQKHFKPPYSVVTADADGQHRVKDIVRVVKLAKKNPDALVTGCRLISREMPLRNWFGNFYTKIAFLFATGRHSTDTQTGLRGFSDRAVPFMLGVKGRRYEYEMNVLLWWARCNRPMVEIPIRTIYLDGNSTSHFKAVRDSVIIYGEILRFSGVAFGCFLADTALFCLLYTLLPLQDAAFLAANAAARLGTSLLYFGLLRLLSRRHFPDFELSYARQFDFIAADWVLNTAVLWGLLWGLPPLWAKVLADVLLYLIGFIPQRKMMTQRRFDHDDIT